MLYFYLVIFYWSNLVANNLDTRSNIVIRSFSPTPTQTHVGIEKMVGERSSIFLIPFYVCHGYSMTRAAFWHVLKFTWLYLRSKNRGRIFFLSVFIKSLAQMKKTWKIYIFLSLSHFSVAKYSWQIVYFIETFYICHGLPWDVHDKDFTVKIVTKNGFFKKKLKLSRFYEQKIHDKQVYFLHFFYICHWFYQKSLIINKC